MNDNDNDNDTDIPLSQIRTQSSSTAVRPPASDVSPDAQTSNEKTGLFHRRGGKRQIRRRRIGTDGEPERVTGLGKFYKKVVNFSVITRYLIYVAPIASAIAVPIVVGKVTEAGRNAYIAGLQMFWFFLWIEIVWLSIWVSKLFAMLVPRIFVFLCGVVSSGTRKYAMVLRCKSMTMLRKKSAC